MNGINWKKYKQIVNEAKEFDAAEKLGKYDYDMKGLAKYMSKNNKQYSDLTKSELLQFNVRA